MAWGKKKNKGYSYFGTNVTLEGRLCFSGVIRLDGRVNGDIISNGSLIIEETAVVTGNIIVESIILSGSVYGNIKAFRHVQLNSVAKVYGHISYAELSFNGALHEGSSHKMTDEEIKNTENECLTIMEAATNVVEKSLPDEETLEEFSSLIAQNAKKQTIALLGKNSEIDQLEENRPSHKTEDSLAIETKIKTAPAEDDIELQLKLKTPSKPKENWLTKETTKNIKSETPNDELKGLALKRKTAAPKQETWLLKNESNDDRKLNKSSGAGIRETPPPKTEPVKIKSAPKDASASTKTVVRKLKQRKASDAPLKEEKISS